MELSYVEILKVWWNLALLFTQMTDYILTVVNDEEVKGHLNVARDRLVSTFWTLSPANALFIWGLRVYGGAVLARYVLTTLFILFKLIRKKTTMVVALGTGTPASKAKKAAWRVTVPARDASLTALKFAEFGLYLIELVGLAAISIGLFESLFAPRHQNLLTWFFSSLLNSIFRLRWVVMCVQYPFEIFVLFPLVYAWYRYRAVASLAKAKVTVTQITNVYNGGTKEKKVSDIDTALICAIAVEATGIPWLALHFLTWRQAVGEIGVLRASRAYWVHFWNQERPGLRRSLDLFILSATYPLSVAASLLAGTRRPVLVPSLNANFVREDPPARPRAEPAVQSTVQAGPLGAQTLPVTLVPRPRERNGLVEIFKFPHEVPLDVFSKGEAMLIGGDRLPEIGVVTSDRLKVRIPMKPVVNNTFALDLLSFMPSSGFSEALMKLTKVPPNVYRNFVELQKFARRDINWDPDTLQRHSNLTEREFIIAALDMVLGVSSTDRVKIPDLTPTARMEDYLNSDTRKSHPGWTTRAFGGQTRGEAWTYSLPRAVALWNELRGGSKKTLREHVWLFLGVVKKQATRKEDAELRSRGAVIPEQEVQLCWRTLGRPLQKFVESKNVTWMPKFELFHRGLEKHWRAFASLSNYDYSNEDMTDHGASIEQVVASIIVDWVEKHTVSPDGLDLGPVARLLFDEMITAVVGLPHPDGSVHLFRTSRGMKDGVDGTSFWGGLAKIIGELHKIWRAWQLEPKLRSTFKDMFDVVRSIKADVHGDNALTAYPKPLTFLAGVNPAAVKWLSEIGFTVKPEESAVTENLSEAYLMSWKMANVGSSSSPRIVGWKSEVDLMKGFFLPERLLDYDHMSPTTIAYLGEILTALYILGYWNLRARRLIEVCWCLLWDGSDEQVIRITHIKDFVYKTGLDADAIEEVSTRSLTPYPPTKVATLWLGPTGERFVDRYVPEAGTPESAAAFIAPLLKLREASGPRPSMQESSWAIEHSYYD